ncbi:hypothetical protein F2Q68_00002044 [Brassica cretica]|uniref:DNA polymerase epsilon subunit B N-terminal domain-containing protein n=1 Tax=Brassica cretica TaxID=69181 RepID=A0A8S9JEP8_BRACR|nr:hypothetical protein F2Q68_00002044 [Brassica cretica]
MSMRKKIQKKFKTRGYSLKIDALNSILAFADQFPGDDEGEAIDLLLDHLQMENLNSSVVDAESVQGVINLLLGANDAEKTITKPDGVSVVEDRWWRIGVVEDRWWSIGGGGSVWRICVEDR